MMVTAARFAKPERTPREVPLSVRLVRIFSDRTSQAPAALRQERSVRRSPVPADTANQAANVLTTAPA